ncbi:hypothetical protein IMSAG049_01132 [Clostridiales bacterium]|nr:hypothetical protein IMSAG049_01132 [Clostridiales bacterium]
MELMKNAITPKMVGQYLGISEVRVRRCMENGTLPIGVVDKRGKVASYIIFPKALYEQTGFKVNGYEPPVCINGDIDYELLAKSIAAELAQCLTGGKK